MPLPVDSITADTPLATVRQMIAESIKHLIDVENKDPKAAAGQVYGMAQSKWGKAVPRA